MKTYCLCCSSRTIEINQFRIKNSVDYQSTVIGLRCSNCSQLLCVNCIRKLSDALVSIQNDIHSDYENYVSIIHQFRHNSTMTIDKPFIGHCCAIKLRRQQQIDTGNGSNYCKDKLLKRKCINASGENIQHYGGAFCIPCYKIMIQTDTNSMDVFGIGDDYKQDALIHYVIDEQCASELMFQGIYPQTKKPLNWKTVRKDIEITLPHVITSHKKKVCNIDLISYSFYNFISFHIKLICFCLND